MSYRDDIRNEKIGRRKVKNLINNLSKYDENIDGVYVNEYDGSFNKIHHHLVVKTNLKEYDFKYRLLQYWKNVGMSEVEKYDNSLGFSYYMSKHIGKTEMQVFKSIKISKEKFENLKNKNEVMPEYLEEFKTNFWEEF